MSGILGLAKAVLMLFAWEVATSAMKAHHRVATSITSTSLPYPNLLNGHMISMSKPLQPPRTHPRGIVPVELKLEAILDPNDSLVPITDLQARVFSPL